MNNTTLEVALKNQAYTKSITIRNKQIIATTLTNTLFPSSKLMAKSLFEIALFDEEGSYKINSSDLVVNNYQVDEDSMTVNFAPHPFFNIEITIAYVATVLKNSDVVTSQINIKVKGENSFLKVDYIQTEPFVVAKELILSSAPQHPKILSRKYDFSSLQISKGQPIFLKGFFFGSEFPGSVNKVETLDEAAEVTIKYYSGKSLSSLAGAEGFWSWKTVVGFTPADNLTDEKKTFFSYIEKISSPNKLRIQYNSWYEAFMGITEKKFIDAVDRVNTKRKENNIAQFDAYVLDDGWNNYNDAKYTGIDTFRSGSTENKSGFWEFNDKFPSQGKAIAEHLQSLDSGLGLWFGPQGGYELQDSFAAFLQSQNNGTVNNNASIGQAIDVNNPTYLKLTKKFLTNLQQSLHIKYWKFDGFASQACKNIGCGHPVGGDYDSYYYTDLWENWIQIFAALKEQDPHVFINGTCYMNPSPWFLRWVDTIWLQNSGDSEIDYRVFGTISQKAIVSRDKIYYSKVYVEKLGMPLNRFYNHEPIYGNALKVEMTDDEFAEYLISNAVRGPMLWDLHLSPDLMTDKKWASLGKVLQWTQHHYDELAHARMILAGDFENGYGYLSENAGHGIIYLRNPSSKAISYDIPSEVPAENLHYQFGEEKALCAPGKFTISAGCYVVYQF